MIELPTIESKLKDLEISYNSFKAGQPFFNGQLDIYTYESNVFTILAHQYDDPKNVNIIFTPDENATVEATLTLYDDNGAVYGYNSDSMRSWTSGGVITSIAYVYGLYYESVGAIRGKITLKASCPGILTYNIEVAP